MNVAELSPEQVAWLTANMEAYEFYLLHACTHDLLRRVSVTSVPVESRDFSAPKHGLYYEGIALLQTTSTRVGMKFPESPTAETLRMAVRTASTMSANYSPQEILDADALCDLMADRTHEKEWYFLDTFFAAWFSSSRAKQYARAAQRVPIADAEHMLTKLKRDVNAAAVAFQSDESDGMHEIFHGVNEIVVPRRPTGIEGLNRALNGGWGLRECYLLFGGTGSGKCHGKGTKVLMVDGNLRNVEDIRVGDAIMGPDSTPRIVAELVRGREQMFRITPHRAAAPVTVNIDHILTLAVTNIGRRVVRSASGVEARSGALIDVTLRDYLASSKKFKHVTKWVQADAIHFPEASSLPIPAYLLGFWLGAGSSWHPTITKPGCMAMLADEVRTGWKCVARKTLQRCESVAIVGGMSRALRDLNLIRNKHIPHCYLTASMADRAALLAGLLDSDGSVCASGWEFSNTARDLVEGAAFLARSIGYSATVSEPRVTYGFGLSCVSSRVCIQPYGSVTLPCKRTIPRPRKQIKNPRMNGFSVESIGVDDYYGFTLIGVDRRYLLGDFAITHNSIVAAQIAWNEILHGGYPLIVSTELRQATYVMRILSNAASVHISDIGDLKNMLQVRNMVAAKYPHKQMELSAITPLIQKHLRVVKIDAEAGLAAGGILEREAAIATVKHGHAPTLIIFDWLGTVADVSAAGSQSSSDRAFRWELAANSCVAFADSSAIPTVVFAQATNDAQDQTVLSLSHIGIAKGIGKNMHVVVGVTNKRDAAGIKAAVLSGGDMPEDTFLADQLFCVCKARNGVTINIPVTREFEYQRFVAKYGKSTL